MKNNSALLRLKGWPKIHHPLPQTPRESQQLLSALTSSFRRQLDAADTHKPAQSASEHLDAILENPLFRVVPSKPTYPTHESSQKRQQATEDALKLAKDPMRLLDDNVAAGTLTGRILKEVLRSQLALIKADSKDVQQEMKSTGAGARVAKWFWASDSASRKSFFKNVGASKASIMFMVAEGLHKELRALLRALYRADLGGGNGQIPRRIADKLFATFLLDYIEAEIQHGQGLPKVADSIPKDPESTTYRESLLKATVFHFARFMGQDVSAGIFKEVPSSLFDRYCNILDTLPGLRPYGLAMQLYHPTQPDSRPFQKYLRDVRTSPSPPRTEMGQDLLLQTSLNALRLLIDQEKYRDATKFSRHVKNMLFEERVLHRQNDSFSPQMDQLMDRLTSAENGLSFRWDPL
ncbi:conserved hypothetical protein [Talaromyces stipitatus ATCC 10500]|uniref:Uncharacterized protein n=1 Tax=Talaromyces stipitatus (strain ATCC 10500 / CBS 375.48 / QM 6759 / NRRL 1006) TaxID=441959 RepID=B8M546_TALSN|nr:uncharacterized protein TSTA_029290 [Talaromyces stipitatus ATCC 10500]EED19652.1 conserved hypothetical protein [Talaromyces stipitatus ATCC 10500]